MNTQLSHRTPGHRASNPANQRTKGRDRERINYKSHGERKEKALSINARGRRPNNTRGQNKLGRMREILQHANMGHEGIGLISPV